MSSIWENEGINNVQDNTKSGDRLQKRNAFHRKDETAYNNSLTRPSKYNNDDNVNNADSTTIFKGEKIVVIALVVCEVRGRSYNDEWC